MFLQYYWNVLYYVGIAHRSKYVLSTTFINYQ